MTVSRGIKASPSVSPLFSQNSQPGFSALFAAGLLVALLAPLTSCSGQGGGNGLGKNGDLHRSNVYSSTHTVSTVKVGKRQQGEDWPAFLGPRGDGTSGERGVDPGRWTPHPPLVWTLDLGTSYGGPAIVDGRLLQFDRFRDRERLTCYEATTARQLWSWETPVEYSDMYGYNNGPRCSPIVDDDRVYTYGVAGQLSCVDLKSGEPQWTKNLNEEYSVVQNFFGVASHPTVHGDLLLVMVGGSPPDAQNLSRGRLDMVQPNGTAIVAFDKYTGEERYRVGNDLASYASLTVREIGGRTMGLGFCRSGLLAWEPDSGRKLFEFPWRADMLESVNAAVPVTHEQSIFLSEAYQIGSVLLQVDDGSQPRVAWRDEGVSLRSHSFRAHWATPVLIDGYLYGCSGRNPPDSDFRCVRLSDGNVQWTDRSRARSRSSVLAVDGYLIVLGELGTLELMRPDPAKLEVLATADLREVLDPRDGAPLLSPPCWFAPVLSHGLLYLRGADKLICLELIPGPEAEAGE